MQQKKGAVQPTMQKNYTVLSCYNIIFIALYQNSEKSQVSSLKPN
uniref:Uncharacterized protein n=1 Tax=Rhizophora mucronata TaxID=61149 RepID=A0A2P2QPU4_RHIMU